MTGILEEQRKEPFMQGGDQELHGMAGTFPDPQGQHEEDKFEVHHYRYGADMASQHAINGFQNDQEQTDRYAEGQGPSQEGGETLNQSGSTQSDQRDDTQYSEYSQDRGDPRYDQGQSLRAPGEPTQYPEGEEIGVHASIGLNQEGGVVTQEEQRTLEYGYRTSEDGYETREDGPKTRENGEEPLRNGHEYAQEEEPPLQQSHGKSVTFSLNIDAPELQTGSNGRVVSKEASSSQEEEQFPDAAKQLENRFFKAVDDLESRNGKTRPLSAKPRMETHVLIDTANDRVEFTKFDDTSDTGTDGVIKQQKAPTTKSSPHKPSRPLSAKKNLKGVKRRPLSAPAKRPTVGNGSSGHRTSYLSDASEDEWEDEPQEENKYLDTQLRHTPNPKIKTWLKQKNQLSRQKRLAEKAIVKQKKLRAQQEQLHRRQRHEKSQVAMEQWMEKKKEEAKSLARQARQNELQARKEMALCCCAHLPLRTFTNLSANAITHSCSHTSTSCHQPHACPGTGHGCCKSKPCCTTHPVCLTHEPPKRLVPVCNCYCQRAATHGIPHPKGPISCICGFAEAQKLKEEEKKEMLAFTPRAITPKPPNTTPITPSPIKALTAAPTLSRPTSAKRSFARPTSAKANTAPPKTTGNKQLSSKPGSTYLNTEEPQKTGEVNELVKKRMTYGNWMSYDNWVNITHGGEIDLEAKQKAMLRARSRGKKEKLTQFQKDIRACSPPRRLRCPGIRPQSAKGVSLSLPSPLHPTKSYMSPQGVHLPSPPHLSSPRGPLSMDYRRYGRQSTEIEGDRHTPRSLLKITLVTDNDALVNSSSKYSSREEKIAIRNGLHNMSRDSSLTISVKAQ